MKTMRKIFECRACGDETPCILAYDQGIEMPDNGDRCYASDLECVMGCEDPEWKEIYDEEKEER